MSDRQIIDAWHSNAAPWVEAIRSGSIESRRLVTDRAIVDAVLACQPTSVIDLGCGEGWLTHALAAQNIQVTGVDAVAELIAQAKSVPGAQFKVASYEQIANGELEITGDLLVCNFSLLGDESVSALFAIAGELLNSDGYFVVQTLEPEASCGEFPYQDGWREGTWAGISGDFGEPAPWYFRTLPSWRKLFTDNGFNTPEEQRTLHPNSGQVLSLILSAQKRSFAEG